MTFKRVTKFFSTVRMQLVASVFIAIAPALTLTYLVNQTWFWEFAPDWLKQYALDVPWASFSVGLLALFAAWFGGEHFILRQVRALSMTAKRIASGDLSARTGSENVEGELGQLAKTFDSMAEALEQRVLEREQAEKNLVNRALQQTVVATLSQSALTNKDLGALMNQACLLVSQTLEVEFSGVWEQLFDGRLQLQAGTGWQPGNIGIAIVPVNDCSQIGFTINSNKPVTSHQENPAQFIESPFLKSHGIVSGVTIVIPTHEHPFGVLGVHTAQQRIFSAEEIQFLLAVANLIGMAAERRRADAAMQKLAAFAQLNPNAAMELSMDGAVTYFNEAAQALAVAARKKHPHEILPSDIEEIIEECLLTERSKSRMETRLNGRTFSWSFHPVTTSGVLHCYAEDITERLNLEEQLRQSQKMESVGQLAAGVAHDFNNMLTIIQGHSSSMLTRPALPGEMLEPVQAIYFAAERAAGLTRQLLMFSRKNVMQPRPLDLREIVGNMSKMLRRLLGETIRLNFNPPDELPLIDGDSGMMEQVIMNLSVNARDAMPRGGTLSIIVEAVTVMSDYVETHPEARLGNFVRLRVTDSGTGMDDATRAHIFEPFFTTKEIGKGTGLGLATVYGIIKQHEGWIAVKSESGKGSTFDVFLPASENTVKFENEHSLPPVIGGTETILVVEDEPVLREMARDILESCGYRIIEAGSGKEALTVWQQNRNDIHLVLTDMVMPEGVSGVDLAEKLLAEHPGLKIIFTSGYTANEVSSETLAKTKAHFLQKPYTHAELAKAVRDSLDKRTGTNVGALD